MKTLGVVITGVVITDSVEGGRGGGGQGAGSVVRFYCCDQRVLDQEPGKRSPFGGWDEKCQPTETGMLDLEKLSAFLRADKPLRVHMRLDGPWRGVRKGLIQLGAALCGLGNQIIKLGGGHVCDFGHGGQSGGGGFKNGKQTEKYK